MPFNQGFGQPNSYPVGSDLFFEVEDAFIHIDLKTVQTRNSGDYTNAIFVGNNQNSYKGRIEKQSGDNEDYEGKLPPIYECGEKYKPCLTFFITILYDEKTLKTLVITIICMPNGKLNTVYDSYVLRAGKNPSKIRFKFVASKFQLLDDTPSRVKVVYFDQNMDPKHLKKLANIREIYMKQPKC